MKVKMLGGKERKLDTYRYVERYFTAERKYHLVFLRLNEPPHVRRSVTCKAIETHNTLKMQDSIHRNAIYSKLSLDTSLM
jgi:hypothetical protein